MSGGWYLWIKALHVVAVISWLAGLLYLPRLFVYHCAAEAGSVQSETFKVMERRLLRAIMNPAMIAAWVFGVTLLLTPGVIDWDDGWIWVKIVLVLLLIYLGIIALWRAFDDQLRAGRIIAVDCVESRLETARLHGAETINFEQEDPVEVIRELTGGIYYGAPRGITEDGAETRAVNTMVYTRPEIERVSRMAFSLARNRRRMVTMVAAAAAGAVGRTRPAGCPAPPRGPGCGCGPAGRSPDPRRG